MAVAFFLLAAMVVTDARAEAVPETQWVEARDGTRLATDVYLPAGAGPFPVLFSRGPYGRNGAKGLAQSWVKAGYAVVSQDVRGRGDSEGEAFVIFNDGGLGKVRDGHDTLAWIAKQPWCDGNVGTHGGSALGITQNLMAPAAPDCLKAQYVVVAFSDMMTECAYQGGCWRLELFEGWLRSQGLEKKNLPEFLTQPLGDPFWQDFNAVAVADQVNAPGVFLGGWYDIFAQGTINSFTSIQHRGGPRAKGNCRLIMGPFAHGTFSTIKYPNADLNRDLPEAGRDRRYMDHFLRGESNGVSADAPVHYYVMGDPDQEEGNEWRSAADWPIPAEETAFYLHEDGTLAQQPPIASEASRSYDYDPRHPVPTAGGQNLILAKGPMDQRPIEGRADMLLFTTEVFEEPLEITGRIRARLWIASDCPDTDFVVKLTDVYPDGRSMLVTDGIQRTRFRNGWKEEFLEPGEPVEIEIDLWSTSLIVGRGHRLRVAVTSSNHPRFEPNPNNGLPFRAPGEPRVAHNTVHLSRERPSRIVLPIVHARDAATAVGRSAGD